ncbi:transporter [Schaalia sp. 19OD2882]|uniref:aspartate:alanine exchanger family transporter n=1 Tax=Schaalia sp. 19OD2882 TaxID=2794089 RepID=UPI001C1EBE03|nr:TrkA C-terminal domain-containing protein [Schaalia sp. 19OD2882]QWW19349.1 transporter [Schaalia sp. 19OD2882]
MSGLLAANPLLTLFLVVALGAAIGAARLGPMRLGAAGALFVGLVLSASVSGLDEGMSIVQQIGLALFVYTVGVAAGATFLSDLRTQRKLLLACVGVCILGALVTVAGVHLLGVDRALGVGLFTGALTAAAALDAATRITGDPAAAVGYAFGYPIGVIISILIVSVVVTRTWLGRNDAPSLASKGLDALTVRVRHTMSPRNLAAWREQRIRMSYLRRDGRTRVLVPGEELRRGDLVLMVGDPDSLNEAFKHVGEPVSDHLADDRSDVAFERVVVSNPEIAGRTVGELGMAQRFGAAITRVRRGDLDLLARDDLALQLGDHVGLVVPTQELDAAQSWIGDSERRVSEVDAMAFGIGMVLGLLLGSVPLPVPGGAVFTLGPAAGPLIVGMLLGALRRTGPLVWTLPLAANLTIRQIGLMLFLAALGLGAGPAFASLLTGLDGWKSVVLSALVVTVCCLALALAGRLLGLSAARTAGSVAGLLGQPALLQAASARVVDERIEAAYATLFAFAMILKILMVPLIWVL